MDLESLRHVIQKHFAGRQVDLVKCSPNDMASVLAPWLARRIKLIIAAGGDGTLADVVSGLPANGPVVGILPLGTGNVVARELDVPVRLDRLPPCLPEILPFANWMYCA